MSSVGQNRFGTTITNLVEHSNNVRLYSALGYITPADFLAGRGPAIW